MVKFAESEYSLIRLFHKLPHPFLSWPILILIINFLASYRANVGFLADAESINFYIGNSIFAILALFLIVIVYEKNMRGIGRWIEEKDLLTEKSNAFNRLKKIHKYLFGWHQILVVIAGVLVRRMIAYFTLPEMTLLGTVVNDTILMFLIFSLILTSLGVILCIYSTGSNGIKVKHIFEIRSAYKNLVSLSVNNCLYISLYLIFYLYAVILWVKKNNQYTSGILISLLFILSIFLIFIIQIAGIRNGLAMSKQNMLNKVKTEMDKIEPLYNSLMGSLNTESTSELFGAILARECLSRKYKDIEGINEWIFNPESMMKIALASISSIIIPLSQYLQGVAH